MAATLEPGWTNGQVKALERMNAALLADPETETAPETVAGVEVARA